MYCFDDKNCHCQYVEFIPSKSSSGNGRISIESLELSMQSCTRLSPELCPLASLTICPNVVFGASDGAGKVACSSSSLISSTRRGVVSGVGFLASFLPCRRDLIMHIKIIVIATVIKMHRIHSGGIQE